jgi:3',5'-cyclic AMP phosphodiesterase CpdA
MADKKTFTLAHFSDLHLFSGRDLSVSELLNKRILGYLSWRLHRRTNHRKEVLAGLLHDLQRLETDHIAITGDLTHLGRAAEFSRTQELLDRLGSPSKVSVVPGNHDAYIAANWMQTYARWAPYMASDSDYGDNADLSDPDLSDPAAYFPMLRIRGQIALIGVSTARPSAPFFATGKVGALQMQKFEHLLTETARRGLFRAVLIHHPPVPGVVSWRKRLTDAANFRAVIKRRGAELILHGHVHRRSKTQLQTPAGSVPVISVPAVSSMGRTPGGRARFHTYQIRPTDSGWNVLLTMYRYSATEKHFRAEDDHRFVLPRSATDGRQPLFAE